MSLITVPLIKNIPRLTKLLAYPIITILLIFNLRRILFTITIFFTDHRKSGALVVRDELPKVLVLVPCRNEVDMIPGLCRAVSQLDYPLEKIRVVLIDDGSTDGTAELMQQQVKSLPGWHVFPLSRNLGKAGALNAALTQFSFGEIVYIFDADHRPEPNAIRRAMRYFENATVAAVTGFTKVQNPVASSSAYYATIESYINQLITTRAKDRLDLGPPLLGSNCGYRREILMACGGFRNGAFSEDSDLTVSFHKAGYRVRFAEDAVSYQQVPQTIRGYLRQHIRWGRGIQDVAKTHGLEILQQRSLALPLRFELLLFTAGYLDRIALAGAVCLVALSRLSEKCCRFSPKVILFALVTPLAQIIALFVKEHMPREMWFRLPVVPAFFLLDIFAAVRATLDTLLNRAHLWTKTERAVVQAE